MKTTPNRLPVLLVALGGNALVRKGQVGTIAEQFATLRGPMEQIARLAETHRIIITHGNGPQVGNLLLQQECCPETPRLPLEILVAQTQGQIGYMIESTLDAALSERGVHKLLVSLISYVVVDGQDPAMRTPDKPVGPVLTEEQARVASYAVRMTPKGWRRVVASPRPVTVVERREIAALVEAGFIVICCGGGGIPVTRHDRRFDGVDAVIDKDLASSRLAIEVGVDQFCIATDVPGAYLDYGSPRQRLLRRIGTAQAREFLAAGHFPPGSMGPKVEACLEFLTNGGKKACIAGIDDICDAVEGKTGTWFDAD